MNIKENRKKWLAALRSGEYVQTKEELCNGNGAYCCLGVLCNVYEIETGGVLDKNTDGLYDVEEDTLEEIPQVMEWVGLKHHSGQFEGQGYPHTRQLTHLNDSYDWNFNQIADLIESEPEGLFV